MCGNVQQCVNVSHSDGQGQSSIQCPLQSQGKKFHSHETNSTILALWSMAKLHWTHCSGQIREVIKRKSGFSVQNKASLLYYKKWILSNAGQFSGIQESVQVLFAQNLVTSVFLRNSTRFKGCQGLEDNIWHIVAHIIAEVYVSLQHLLINLLHFTLDIDWTQTGYNCCKLSVSYSDVQKKKKLTANILKMVRN